MDIWPGRSEKGLMTSRKTEKGLGFANEMNSNSEFEISQKMNRKYFCGSCQLFAEGDSKRTASRKPSLENVIKRITTKSGEAETIPR
jgi:hypothetical protein